MWMKYHDDNSNGEDDKEALFWAVHLVCDNLTNPCADMGLTWVLWFKKTERVEGMVCWDTAKHSEEKLFVVHSDFRSIFLSS